MNLLIVSEHFAVGGLESRLKGMITFLSQKGWKIYLACGPSLCRENLPAQIEEVFSDLPFDVSQPSFASIESGILRLQQIIRDYSIDLVDLHPFGSLLPGALAAHELQTPFVVHLHGPLSLGLGDRWYDLTTRFCVLTMAPMTYAVSSETYSLANVYVDASQLELLPNGVNLDLFRPSQREPDPGRWAVLCRLDGVKEPGVQKFCSMACHAGIQSIDIFGNGPGTFALTQWVKSEGLGERVHFKGASLDVASDLAHQPYQGVAGMGRVVLEAAAMNLPVCLVGYEGVKGVLDAELFKSSAWWNFSGRGLPDIAWEQFKNQLEHLQEEPEKYQLRHLVEEHADEKRMWEKYHESAIRLKSCNVEGAQQVRSLIKAFSNDQNPLLANQSAMGEIFRVLDPVSSRSWSQSSSHDQKNLRDHIAQLQIELDAMQSQKDQLQKELEVSRSQKDQLQIEADQVRSDNQKLNESLAAWEGKARRVVALIKQYETHASFRIVKLLQVLKHPEIVGVKSSSSALATALMAKVMNRPLAADYSPFGPILQELTQAMPAESSQMVEPSKPLSVYGRHEYQRLLRERLPKCKGVFVHALSINWNVPLFSRPQHIAMAMRDCGYLVIYADFKETEGFMEIQDNLFLAGGDWILDFICRDLKDSIISIYSTSWWWGEKTNTVSKLRERNNTILYEYIDHIDPKISGEGVKDLSRLFKCMKEGKEDHLFVGSAKMLCDELAQEIPSDRIALVPNGVDCRHYMEAMQHPASRQQLSSIMKYILGKGRPIVGYFGALAHWLDYDLLKEVIASKPDYDFVFIGPDYYGGSNLLPSHLPNCHWLGVVHYDVLPYYARHFDIAIIPFERGNVAKSTSPLKLFEYFALEKPVVVTADLLECLVYPEVFVGENPDAFCLAIDEALEQSKNAEFKEKLKHLALQNTWQCRARVLDEFVQEHVGFK